MATHSSILPGNPMDGAAWWAAVHGVTKSRTRLSDFTFTFMNWRKKWQPTPVFLPGESQGQRSLVGCRLWGRTGLDMTEATQQQQRNVMDGIMIPTTVTTSTKASRSSSYMDGALSTMRWAGGQAA